LCRAWGFLGSGRWCGGARSGPRRFDAGRTPRGLAGSVRVDGELKGWRRVTKIAGSGRRDSARPSRRWALLSCCGSVRAAAASSCAGLLAGGQRGDRRPRRRSRSTTARCTRPTSPTGRASARSARWTSCRSRPRPHARGAQGPLLPLRPWTPPSVPDVPRKDDMGMDFVPVYDGRGHGVRRGRPGHGRAVAERRQLLACAAKRSPAAPSTGRSAPWAGWRRTSAVCTTYSTSTRPMSRTSTSTSSARWSGRATTSPPLLA